jgi:HSP20 family protein
MKELLGVQKRMNRLFESALAATEFDSPDGVGTWTPVCDVAHTAKGTVLWVELPGLKPDQIDVRLEGNDVVISGERKVDRDSDAEHFHRVERPYGKFQRRFHLPADVDRHTLDATYRNGVLRITLPHRGERAAEPQRVDVH